MTNDVVQDIVGALVAARKAKGLSQRDLGVQAGAPQSHLSRVERGKVDVRASTLIELARLLDLEVMLVPRQWVPAVRRLIGPEEPRAPFLYRLDG
jgi:HTH-type transcriptional regulator / antitoxin HipB